jgi:type I restriction enzyme, S subunit
MKNTKFKQTEIGLIPEDWDFIPLGKNCKILMGQSPKSEYYNINGNGTPFLQGITTFGDKYPIIDTWTTNITKLAKRGTVLFSVRAPVGEANICIIDTCIGRGLLSIDSKNNEFMYYLLKALKGYIVNKEKGTVYGSVTQEDVKNILLPFPPLSEQKTIAKILSDLDSKIELNQQMNKTLEEIGKTLFKRWFVDFEFPNEEGKPHKLSGGEMVYNEKLKKKIPKDWRLDHLGNIVDLNWGDMNTTKMSYIDIGFPTYSASGLDGKMDHFDYDSKGIILSAIGANCGKTWFANGKWSCIKNTIRIIPKEQEIIEFIYFLSNDSSFWPKRGSAQPFVSQTDARNIEIIIPKKAILSIFIKQSSHLLDKIRQNELENIELIKIRDLLLPKLMSGKIRVKY